MLRNRTVLIACSEQKVEALTTGLERLGARVILFPTIQIREVSDKRPMDAALNALEDYSWIIFTSRYGVSHLVRRMTERRIPVERWQHLNVCAIGPSTSAQLEQSGIRVSLIPEEFTAEGVVAALDTRTGGIRALKGKRILLARALQAREEIPNQLTAAGAQVDIVPCYENVLPTVAETVLQSVMAESLDLLVFTSSSTATNAATLLGDKRWKQLLERTSLAALGPVTAKTLASLGKEAEIVPTRSTVASLLDAIGRYYGPVR